jgi:gluconate 5-dehydrogenase
MSAREFNAGLNGILTLQFTCARIAARHMLDNGSIVNVGSLWGLRSPDPKIYLDLKNEPSVAIPCAYGGVHQLTRYLAVLLAPKIRVNALVPGWFPKARGAPRPDYIAGITTHTPMGRIGAPSDLVGAAVFLMADASAFMTGQQLVIDGGYSIQ